MQSIQNIAREALKQLLREGKSPTPDAYAEAFYNYARKKGIKIGEENSALKSMLSVLDEEIKDTLLSQEFKNKDEWIIYLVRMLNQFYFYKKNFTTQLEILRILLRLLANCPQKEISSLAKGQLLELDNSNLQNMQIWKERWNEQVRKTPEIVGKEGEVLAMMSEFQIDNLDFKEWQCELKEYLKEQKIPAQTPKIMSKLEEVLKKNLNANTSSLNNHNTLQYHSSDALPLDSMTTLISKEGIQKVLEFAEEEYQKSHKNYSIIVFGIVSYHKIVESFGSEAGKRILATLGRLLKEYSTQSDLIAYYSKEEFLACLLDRSKEEAIDFIQTLSEIVKKSIFMYQKTRIHIELSAQISYREDEESMQKMLETTLESFQNNKDNKGIL